MSRTTLSRIVRLERAGDSKEAPRVLIAASRLEAAELLQQHPDALVIVTGVARSLHGVVR
jgi:hypothetical protein